MALLVQFCVALIYKVRVANKRPRDFPCLEVVPPGLQLSQSPHDFANDLCTCCEDKRTCCLVFWCDGVRVADTYAAAGLASFWIAIVQYAASDVVATIVTERFSLATDAEGGDLVGNMIRSLGLAVIFFRKRQALKAKLGAPVGTRWLKDFVLWWCCTLCVVVQEARQVDAVQQVDVQCCCHLQDLRPAPGVDMAVVGVPVVVANRPPVVALARVSNEAPLPEAEPLSHDYVAMTT